jgi:uncharacterized membrane protein YkvA (DUF1232 family)
MAIKKVAATKALWDFVRGARRPGAPSAGDRVAALPRMVGMSLSGRYPFLPRHRLLLMGAALLYVLMPIDLLPELLLPVIGLGDDALVLAWLVGAVLAETEAFLAWERSRVQVVAGRVVG